MLSRTFNFTIAPLKQISFITARKRSLRRLCFYRCLSFCPRGGMRGCSGVGGVHGCSGGHVWLLRGGDVWLLWGGMHGSSRGVCVVALGGVWLLRGHAWLLQGACVVALGGHVWLLQGACMVAWGAWVVAPGGGGMHGCSRGACAVALGGHAWFFR